jgi:DNA-binding NarL/FixJ family response regulator
MLPPDDDPRRERTHLTGVFTNPVREKIRALLIDHDSSDRLLFDKLSAKSRQLSFAVSSCASTAEAHAVLETDQFDVLYVDYWMETETSIVFINQFARSGAAPCVLLTGLDDPDIRRLAFRAGAKAFLSKDELSVQAIEGVTLAVLNQQQAANGASRPSVLE